MSTGRREAEGRPDTHCATARHTLVAALSGASVSPADRDTAEAHVLSCPSCRSRLWSLARAVTTPSEDALSCAECVERVAPGMDSAAAPRSWAPDAATVAHMATCPSCAALRDEVQAALEAFEEGSLPEVADWPAFDTAFVADPSPVGTPVDDGRGPDPISDRRRLVAALRLAGWSGRLERTIEAARDALRPSARMEHGPRREGMASALLLAPIAVALLLVLGLTWVRLRSTEPPPTPVPPLETVEGWQQATATAGAARTPGLLGPPGPPTAPTGIAPAQRATATPAVGASASPPVEAATTPEPTSRRTRGGEAKAATAPPDAAYPPPAVAYPTSAYPAPPYPGPGYPPPRATYGPGGTGTPSDGGAPPGPESPEAPTGSPANPSVPASPSPARDTAVPPSETPVP